MSAPVALRRHGELAAMRRGALRLAGAGARARRGRVRVSLWLPVTPLFAVLAPLVMLLAPLMLLAPPLWRVNPYLAAFTLGRVLLSLGGTEVDVDAHDARIHIRLF